MACGPHGVVRKDVVHQPLIVLLQQCSLALNSGHTACTDNMELEVNSYYSSKLQAKLNCALSHKLNDRFARLLRLLDCTQVGQQNCHKYLHTH